jgi:signal transduction histidine kinase
MMLPVEATEPLSAIAHEVRNLIATFVGFSELLLTQDWPPEKQREFLETMRSEGLRVSQFLNELLDLERLEAGATRLEPRRTNMADLLRLAADTRSPSSCNASSPRSWPIPIAFNRFWPTCSPTRGSTRHAAARFISPRASRATSSKYVSAIAASVFLPKTWSGSSTSSSVSRALPTVTFGEPASD